MLKNFAIFAINFFIFVSLAIRFFGIGIGSFENHTTQNRYFFYGKIAKKELADPTIHGVILVPEKKLQIIKILKKPIGMVKVDQDAQIKAVDTLGNLFILNPENQLKNLITVNGNYSVWPKFHRKLEKLNLTKNIYRVNIHAYQIDIFMHPGVVVLLDITNTNALNDLKEFYQFYPQFFEKGTLIDLRNTKRIGISKLSMPKNSLDKKSSSI